MSTLVTDPKSCPSSPARAGIRRAAPTMRPAMASARARSRRSRSGRADFLLSLAEPPRASLRVSLRGSVHLLWRGLRGRIGGGPLAGPPSGCLGDLCGGPTQRRPHLVGLDLDDRSLLALLGFP